MSQRFLEAVVKGIEAIIDSFYRLPKPVFDDVCFISVAFSPDDA